MCGGVTEEPWEDWQDEQENSSLPRGSWESRMVPSMVAFSSTPPSFVIPKNLNFTNSGAKDLTLPLISCLTLEVALVKHLALPGMLGRLTE